MTERQSVIVWSLSLTISLGLLAVLWLFASPLALLFIGITIAAAFSPIVKRLEQYLPRLAAILLVYGAAVSVLIILGLLIVPPVVQQGRILGEELPDLLDEATTWLDQREVLGQNVGENIVDQIGSFSSSIISLPLSLLSASLDIFIVFVISIYLLLDANRIREFGASLFPQQQREHVLNIAGEMLRAAGGYVRGVTINIVLISLIMSVGLTIIGVNFAVVLGIFAGFMEIFPIVGPFIGAIPVLLLALIDSPSVALITLIFVLIVQFIEGNILIPSIMHQEAHVPPYIVMFALLAGGAIGGVLGAVTAIPLAAVLRVFFLRVIVPEIKEYTFRNQNADS